MATSEEPYRTAILVLVLVLVPILLYHRIRSQATREKLDRRQEGLFILLTLRPVGLAFVIGLIVYLSNPAAMRWSSVALPDAVRSAGIAVGVLGGALLVWTLVTLGKNLTDTVVTRQAHTLVTRGPYRWVRHPFYDAVALLLVAISLLAANAFLFLAGLAVLSLIRMRTRKEEELLLARFGSEYQEYMRRTGRFFPRL